MSAWAEIAVRSVSIGVIATALLDLFNVFRRRLLKAPVPDWRLVGRWVGHFPHGKFVHDSIGNAAPIRGEHALGWAAHYAVGITFATIAVLAWGLEWARHPTFVRAFVVGLASVVAPLFIMQPGMGLGIAASKAPNPTQARLRTLMAHSVFGAALYLAALTIAAVMSV